MPINVIKLTSKSLIILLTSVTNEITNLTELYSNAGALFF